MTNIKMQRKLLAMMASQIVEECDKQYPDDDFILYLVDMIDRFANGLMDSTAEDKKEG